MILGNYMFERVWRISKFLELTLGKYILETEYDFL